jgi:ethanolamine utilization microcompartment shell protein EutS
MAQNDDNPTLSGCSQQLRLIQKFKPKAFAELAAAIARAAADVKPDLGDFPVGTKALAALRLTPADARTIALRDDERQRHANAVGSLGKDRQKCLQVLIGNDPAAQAEFLASLPGATP